MGRTACTEPQCLYKGDIYLFFYAFIIKAYNVFPEVVTRFIILIFMNLRFTTDITMCYLGYSR